MERRKREECGGRWKVVDLSEMDGTRCALIREIRIFREPCGGGAGIQSRARKFYEDRKSLIYKYICRKMIYFAIKTA